jgi:hypothetical protein
MHKNRGHFHILCNLGTFCFQAVLPDPCRFRQQLQTQRKERPDCSRLSEKLQDNTVYVQGSERLGAHTKCYFSN